MVLPLSVRPAGSPVTVSVEPTDGAIVVTNGRPAVPPSAVALSVGSGQAPTGMSIDAVAPQAAVTIAWMLPVSDGVPLMVLPLSVRPAGSPVTSSVEPGVITNVVRNGSPTVAEVTFAVTDGSGQALITMSAVDVAPQSAVAV